MSAGPEAAAGDAMRVTLASASFDMVPLAQRLAQLRPGWQVRVWPQPGFEAADVVIGWNCPPGLYDGMPRLRLVHGIAAGVDNLIAGQDLRGLPVCRVVNDDQARGMVEYVLWSVLYFHRGFDRVLSQHAQQVWQRPAFRAASDCTVGVMGLGAMGALVARALAVQGYAVRGWSRSSKVIDDVRTFSGPDGLPGFLQGLDQLVCLLPLTPETRAILGRATFSALPRGAALIHAGRGEHLVPDDLRDALASGQLRGAIVDVFAREPLAAGDPLWRTPGLLVTPHMATLASPDSIAQQIVGNIDRLACGQALHHTVDVTAGY